MEASIEDLEAKDSLVSSNGAAKVQRFYTLLTSSLEVIKRFCDRIPGISELSQTDQDLLFQSSCLELFCLRLAYRYAYVKPLRTRARF